MEWRAEGVLLAVRRHGESAAIIEVFTESMGRAAGLVRGGGSRRWAPVLQPGAQLDVTWRARLAEHLGTFTVEPLAARAAMLGDRAALAGLGAVTGLISFALPERHAYPPLYRETVALLDLMEAGGDWQPHYVAWELALLAALGFGLDLTRCAATGALEDLAYVSPKTGRAVSREAGASYVDRLLPLPPFLRTEDGSDAPITADDLRAGLKLTGYFLSAWACPALGKAELPPARDRLVRAFSRL